MADQFVTAFNGLLSSDNPTDAAECFNRPSDYYLGEEVIMAEIDGKPWPLQICGDTNTGMSYRGCHHGPTNASAENPLCHIEFTGEMVIAQACILECSYVIDPLFGAEVIIALIDGQWFIVNVVSDPHDIQPPGEEYDRCDGACCDLQGMNLSATVSGCGAFDGAVIQLSSSVNGPVWDGDVTVGGETLSVRISCNSVNNSFEAAIGCGGALTLPDHVDISCNHVEGTGTDAVSGGFGGSISNSGSIGCTDCDSITLSIGATEQETKATNCYNTITTGEYVRARACGLPNLKEGSYVIIAQFPDGAGDEGGGGVAGCSDDNKKKQWNIILACDTDVNCPPCPPPPPPPTAACCDLDPGDIPGSLVGVFRLGSNDAGCSCPDEIAIAFSLVPGSDPAYWIQDGDLILCDPGSATGTGNGGGAFIGLSNMRVTCSGGGTGSATSTGTGPAALFFLTPPGCEDVHVDPIASANASCDPVYMEFTADISKCCSGSTVPGVRVTLYMELAGV